MVLDESVSFFFFLSRHLCLSAQFSSNAETDYDCFRWTKAATNKKRRLLRERKKENNILNETKANQANNNNNNNNLLFDGTDERIKKYIGWIGGYCLCFNF